MKDMAEVTRMVVNIPTYLVDIATERAQDERVSVETMIRIALMRWLTPELFDRGEAK